jgi:competence protein ComGC
MIEVIVVIGVIMVLSAIAVPQMSAYLERGRAATCLSMRYNTEKAEHAYIMWKNAQSASFADLVSDGLLSRQPACPSGGTYVWLQRTPQPILGCSIHYATSPAEETANILYASSFNGQSGLDKLMGNWNVANGTLNNKPGQENRIAFGDTAWKDYEIKTSAVLTEGNGYGIYYRADGNANITGYVFQYDPGLGNKFVVRKVVDGVEQSPFQTVSMPAGFTVYNQSHDISIAVVGSQHVIKVDNQTVLSFTDSTFASGSGGFRTWGSTAANFDNLSVAQK